VDAAAALSRPLLVFIGPSACGKSTLVRGLAERGVIRVHPTWTTRPPRAGEDPTDETLEHRFVDEAKFSSLEREGFFLGSTQMFGLPHRYGMPRLDLQSSGPVDAVMLRAPLVEQLRGLVPWLLVYQIEADLEQAGERLVERSVDDDEARARMEANGAELEQGRAIANRVFTNDRDMDDLVELVLAALIVDYGPGIRPEGTGARRARSVLERIGIVVAVLAAVLVGGIVVAGLIFMYALSQWGNNK
jgi:guanylate kinase